MVAQAPPIGKFLYEKLANTKQEYRAAMASGDSLEVAETSYLMGKRYSALGDYVTAQSWFIRSLRIREPLGLSEGIGKTYLRMAENAIEQKQYVDALRHTRTAMATFRSIHSAHGLMSAYNLLAGVYELGWKMNREKPGSAPPVSLDSSLYYFHQAERLALALNKPYDIANIYACLGRALAHRDIHQAIPYLKKAYAIDIREKQLYGVINLSQQLADCYLGLRQPTLAKKWLDAATYVRDTARYGDYLQNSRIEATYATYYRQTGQWKQAFEHQEKYFSARISALNADREGAIAQAGMRYESEKNAAKLKAQQQQLALRQQSLRTQERLNQVIEILLGVAGITCLVLYWLFRKYRRISGHNAKLVREQNHRVKNNLQSITSLLGMQYNRLTDSAARQAVEESLLRVEAMAIVHQRLYDGDRLAEINLAQYIPELVGGVLRSFNFGHVQPTYVLSPIWLHADAAIDVGLLLNELVTNACKYALPARPDPTLEIGCREQSGQITLWFADNGPGFTPAGQRNSFGMKLIDMVTQKLKGKKSFTMEDGCLFSLSFAHQESIMLH
ncbi:hypothetical protein GCM10028773_13630 [Spirosoma koreense]